MEKTAINELSRSLLDIAWSFGPKGVNEACCEDLSMVEFLALDGIFGLVECPVHQVGHSLGFTKSGATRIVNRLVAKGYVTKQTAGYDGRVCCLEATSRGRKVLSETYARYENIIKTLFTDLDPKLVKHMKESLIMFSKLLTQETSTAEKI